MRVCVYVHMHSVYVVSMLWCCLQFDKVSAAPEFLEKCQIYKTNWFHISPHKPQKTVGSHSGLGLCGLGREGLFTDTFIISLHTV